jgi:putative ABC transport system permease protein
MIQKGEWNGDPLPGISPHLYVVSMDAREAVDGVKGSAPARSYLKLSDARALVDAARASGQLALAESPSVVSDADDSKHSERATGLMAYGPLLSVLGVPLKYGRPWTPAEQSARAPVVATRSI